MLLSARLKRHNPTFILNDAGEGAGSASPLRLLMGNLEGRGGGTSRNVARNLTPFEQKASLTMSNKHFQTAVQGFGRGSSQTKLRIKPRSKQLFKSLLQEQFSSE